MNSRHKRFSFLIVLLLLIFIFPVDLGCFGRKGTPEKPKSGSIGCLGRFLGTESYNPEKELVEIRIWGEVIEDEAASEYGSDYIKKLPRINSAGLPCKEGETPDPGAGTITPDGHHH